MRVAQIDITERQRARGGVGNGRTGDVRPLGDAMQNRSVGAGNVDRHDRRIVGAIHGDDDVLGCDTAVEVVDLDRIVQRDRLVVREVVEETVRRGERPVLRALHAAGGIAQRTERQPAQLGGMAGQTSLDSRCHDIGDRHLVRIGQIDIGELDRALGLVQCRRIDGAYAFRDGADLLLAGDRRRVVGADDGNVGAIDRDADRRCDHAAMAVIDLDDVVENQRLALGDEIERMIGDAVGPGGRTVMAICGALHHA